MGIQALRRELIPGWVCLKIPRQRSWVKSKMKQEGPELIAAAEARGCQSP